MDAELLRIGVGGVVPVRWDLAKAEEDPGTLTGWASVYNVVDQQDDVVVPGAFKKTLAEWRGSKRVIPLTLSHDNTPNGVIGSLTKAEDTAYGLRASFKFASTADAQAARTKAREGHIGGLSIFGAIVNKAIEMVGDKAVQVIREVKLLSIGLTPLPANTAALVTAAKDGIPGDAGGADGELPDLWVADMRAALNISAAAVRKAAVDALVATRYQVQETTAVEPPAGDTTGDETTGGDHDDEAAKYALSIIGESGPDTSPPGGEPSESLADQLLASIDAVTNRKDLQAFAAEIGALKGE